MGLKCKSEEYLVGERCCDRCQKGQYVRADCDGSKSPVCEPCGWGQYIEGPNSRKKCLECRPCHSTNHMTTARKCAPDRNSQCECMPGFYCTDSEFGNCENCVTVTKCRVGTGVKTKATPWNNTVCTPCLSGTYSDVEDAMSPCHDQARCGDQGRKETTAGTETSDAVCGDLINNGCPWMLPAGLWAGLVVTSIVTILIYIIYRRAKRHSYRTAVSSQPRVSVEAADHVLLAEPPKPEWNGHCQEMSDEEKGSEPLFLRQGDSLRVSPRHQHCDIESDSHPSKPMTALDQLGQSINHTNGYCTSPSLIIQSEPQEDEWSGT